LATILMYDLCILDYLRLAMRALSCVYTVVN
jgi:hypothetical protein